MWVVCGWYVVDGSGLMPISYLVSTPAPQRTLQPEWTPSLASDISVLGARVGHFIIHYIKGARGFQQASSPERAPGPTRETCTHMVKRNKRPFTSRKNNGIKQRIEQVNEWICFWSNKKPSVSSIYVAPTLLNLDVPRRLVQQTYTLVALRLGRPWEDTHGGHEEAVFFGEEIGEGAVPGSKCRQET